MDLTGRVVVVTGGAGHVGSACSDALAELGASVVVLDRKPEACARVADRLSSEFGVSCLPLAQDLADEGAVRKVPATVIDRFGRIDALVNCAALVGASELEGWAVPFENQNVATWRCALEINLTSPFVLAQTCAPALTRSGHGSIVNIGTIYGIVGPRMSLYDGTGLGNPAAYAASKGGLLQLTRWLATTLAPGVRVNAISPGGIRRDQPELFVDRYVEQTPLGRMATEEDLKGAVAYLVGDASGYVTGQNLIVDGGWTIW